MSRIITKVISGGQTGVDIAALRAAKALGIPTGGTMPKGWRTHDGPRPEYAKLYGMVEHPSTDYRDRTFKNVMDADVTIRIALDFMTTGERCTSKAIALYGAWHHDIKIIDQGTADHLYAVPDGEIIDASNWLRAECARRWRAVVVNFAGNSNRTAPGIEHAAEAFVKRILEACE